MMKRTGLYPWGVYPLAVAALWLASALVALQAAEPEPPADTPAVHIRAILGEGVMPKLRYGNFADYQSHLEELYRQNAGLPLWFKDGQPTMQARAVAESIGTADERGLNAADYDAELLRDWLRATNWNPREMASFDVALNLSAMRYVSNLYLGRINPRNVDFGLSIEPKKLDLPNLIQKIAQSNAPKEMIDALEPDFPLYRALKVALPRYRKLAQEMDSPQFSFPAKFGPGSHHKSIPALRHYLYALGDLPDGTADGSERYDPELVHAVKNFQARHGLAGDGVIGKGTQNHLNYPLADRLAQIRLGLERLRWLPQRLPGSYLLVNIPSFQLFGYRDDAALGPRELHMNVIVGEAVDGRHTPVFHADLTNINFRPYWNVPYKITAKELLPIISRNPGYLSSHNMEIVGGGAVYAPSGGNIQMLSTGALRLRQKPGPKNALGLIKFNFPNHNNVYLHSTPTPGLFKRTRRDFSHGCIRVEDPAGLAEFVLAGQGEWSRERIVAAMNAENQKTVALQRAIPVYLFYSTVLADEHGWVRFYEDIYGHDLILQELLAKGFPYPA